MPVLSAADYAKYRGITPTAVRNAARKSEGRPKEDWWDMPGVERFEQIGGRTWVFHVNDAWIEKRKKIMNL